jgi:hypothetical protein
VSAAKVSERRLPGASYRHADGWCLWVPHSLAPMQMYPATSARRKITIGRYSLTLIRAGARRTVEGYIPESWRVDLNADSAVQCEVES